VHSDPASKYYDAKSKREAPTWDMVDVVFEQEYASMVTLADLKQHQGGTLAGMPLFTQTRLSVSPVTPEQFAFIDGTLRHSVGSSRKEK
jgi:predicted RNA-binding protein with PUA-like domain